jgi:hypothetical protein
MSQDHYGVLGVDPGAPTAEIRKAYRRLALEHHPDKVPASRREEATHLLSSINAAWDCLGDADRRRVYDLQRDVEGESALRRRLRTMRWRYVLGVQPRTLPWASGVPYLRPHNLAAMNAMLQRGRSMLLFLHLGGSERSARAAPTVVAVHHALRGALFVAALDAEAEPALFDRLSFGVDGEDLPAIVLASIEGGARLFHHPLNESAIVDAGIATTPDLANVCTPAQYRTLLSASAPSGATRELPIAIAVGPSQRAARNAVKLRTRVACAASTGLLCRHVPHHRCDLPPQVMACPGVALLRGGEVRRCVADIDEIRPKLREHAAHAHGVGRRSLAAASMALGGTPVVRVAAALGDAARGSPLVRPLVSGAAQGLASLQTPLFLGAIAGLLLLVHSLATGRGSGPMVPSWAVGARGRRVSGARRAPWGSPRRRAKQT